MKAINRSVNQKGDDDYFDRLFSYFQSQFYEEIIEFSLLRNSVFLLMTDKHTYILKGYHSNNKLKIQEAFTTTLRKEGFRQTYRFLTPSVKEQLFFEGTYFGCIEYIYPHRTAFTFQSQKNRQEGIDLLEQFHQTTATFETRYRTLIPRGHLVEKWTERLHIFSNHLPFLKYFINDPFISEMISWGEWSLAGMEKHRSFFKQEPLVILHGDVAHHNFLRDKNGKLHLIDFDLISVGPPSFDYVQYANRILPFIDWSFGKLSGLKQMRCYLQEEAFLYALAYPADVFREWNRLIREKLYTDQIKLRQVMDLSLSQFYSRKTFIDQLQEKVK
ncbi:aminoglycoside phosphotransferase family protein [Neobacillus sp. OS1-2]|uniref:aminoglycoside phosphotransferase family protein n=1 Tax=Neobacillus sp. OS1-2 TaxID=3070680 RepID=UPI0027E0A27F|nr:aminoglycoside phosphotransferase family protein [Neobacillus sp. OS1-2]WML40693.1 aminoglycoside phosphotransferase family protein [Neobacillus sp. OS1-2]